METFSTKFFFLLPIIIIPFILFFLIYFTFKSFKNLDKKEKIEEGKEATWSFRCAGMIHLKQYSVSTIRLSLYNDFILIKARNVYIFKYEEFSIQFKKNYTLPTFKIVHNKSEYPELIELSLKNGEENKLKEILDSKLVKVFN